MAGRELWERHRQLGNDGGRYGGNWKVEAAEGFGWCTDNTAVAEVATGSSWCSDYTVAVETAGSFGWCYRDP